MSIETVADAVRFVVQNGLAAPRLTLVWHAGEPMVVSPQWYREAYAAAVAAAENRCEIDQSIQTNGVLLTRSWLEYLSEGDMRLGLSLDGPAAVHDYHRRRRNGRGTHDAVMRGVSALRAIEVPFHVISVVTSKTLDDPESFTTFFEGVGQTSLGLNFEEIEGINSTASVLNPASFPLLKRFLNHVISRSAGNPRLQIREMSRLVSMLRDLDFNQRAANDENTPFTIISVDTKGNLSTFSPELLGQHDHISDGYVFGNVRDHTLEDVLANPAYLRVAQETAAGVAACRRTCNYFRLCHGGAPSNKAAEHGDLTATETLHCRVAIKTFGELLLARLEHDLASEAI